MRRFILPAVALCGLALPALAAEPGTRNTTNPTFMDYPYSQTYRDCMKRDTSTLGMTMCVENERELWDQRLNKVWKNMSKTVMNPKQWLDAQRKWIAFRDSQCKAVVGPGSSGDLDESGCLMNLTIERTLQLEDANWPRA